MRPVFEYALVDALGLAQIGAAIVGDAGIEDMMMAALDHIDGVDLHIAEMGDGTGDGSRAGAERRLRIEPLGGDPEPPCLQFGQGMGGYRAGHGAAL